MEEVDRSHICPVCRKHKFKWFNASEECPVCGWMNKHLRRTQVLFVM